ncbi:acyl-CoA N-acyltransferase [Hyaloscypha variabilis]
MATEPTPRITHSPSLQLSLATPTDLREITEVWYACFPESFVRQMFPYTPALLAWWDAANGYDMAHKPYVKFVVVRDESKEGKGRIVGYAKWWVPKEDGMFTVEERFPEWSEESDEVLCDLFFNQLAKERKELMSERKYYYLDMLGTLPEYRRLGVAAMLMRWVVERTDRDKLECFIDASDKGIPVYEKFGFFPKEPFVIPGMGFTCTTYIRPARP